MTPKRKQMHFMVLSELEKELDGKCSDKICPAHIALDLFGTHSCFGDEPKRAPLNRIWCCWDCVMLFEQEMRFYWLFKRIMKPRRLLMLPCPCILSKNSTELPMEYVVGRVTERKEELLSYK